MIPVSERTTTTPSGKGVDGLEIQKHVSVFLHFHDKKLGQQYDEFKSRQSNSYAFLPLYLACTFFYFSAVMSSFTMSFDWFNILLCILLMVNGVGLGSYMVAVFFKDVLFAKDSKWKYYVDIPYTHNLQSLWVVGISICYGMIIYSTGYNGTCSAGAMNMVARVCNYSGIEGVMPMDLVLTAFFSPIMYMIILKGASFASIMASIFLPALSLFATMNVYNLTLSGPIILLFIPMSVLVLYEFQRQNVSVFLLARSQSELLEEIDRLSMETYAKELRSMIGNVAHDLKTPMSAFVSGLDFITSMLDEIQMKLSDASEVVKGLRAINESVINMKNINQFMRMSINRCIDYTKASKGIVLVPHMETVNFREMLQLPLNCMKNLQDGKVSIQALPVSHEIASFIITDPQWFQENVLCLLSNAVKYSAEGTVTISVSLTSSANSSPTAAATNTDDKDRSMLRVDVEDNGIGIADDLKAQLFTPFKQAQRLVGGTGLGLYSLAKRIEALGGKYGVENRQNGQTGCVFWFAVPYRPDLTIEKPRIPILTNLPTSGSNSNADSPVSARSSRPLNILLVDDSISILKMSGKMLTRLGHRVTTAENGAVALKLFQSTVTSTGGEKLQPKFDVVLMDLQMPIMDGLEATKRLRALEKDLGDLDHQLIVGVSANSDHETTKAAFDAGVDEFIPKPFIVKTFEEVINKLMHR